MQPDHLVLEWCTITQKKFPQKEALEKVNKIIYHHLNMLVERSHNEFHFADAMAFVFFQKVEAMTVAEEQAKVEACSAFL